MRCAAVLGPATCALVLAACGSAALHGTPSGDDAGGDAAASGEAGPPDATVGDDAAQTLDGAAATDAGLPDTGLGATVGPGGVTFRVWAPHATAAAVTGSFASTPLPMSNDGGVWEVTSPAAQAGSTYSFSLVTPAGMVTRTDPYCRQVATAASCTVVDPAAYAWKTPSFARPTRQGSVVYELHVGSF